LGVRIFSFPLNASIRFLRKGIQYDDAAMQESAQLYNLCSLLNNVPDSLIRMLQYNQALVPYLVSGPSSRRREMSLTGGGWPRTGKSRPQALAGPINLPRTRSDAKQALPLYIDAESKYEAFDCLRYVILSLLGKTAWRSESIFEYTHVAYIDTG